MPLLGSKKKKLRPASILNGSLLSLLNGMDNNSENENNVDNDNNNNNHGNNNHTNSNSNSNNNEAATNRGGMFRRTPSTKISRSKWKRALKAKREAKVVQKSAGHVDKIVRELTEGLPFLLSTPNQPIAKFTRSEIVVGNLLGRGVFARVYEVKDFDLHDDEEDMEQQQQETTMLQHLKLSPQEQIIQEMGEGSDLLEEASTSSGSYDINKPNMRQPQFPAMDDDQHDYHQRQPSLQEERPQQPINSAGESSTDSPNGDDSTTAATSVTAPLTPAAHPVGDGKVGFARTANRGSLPPIQRGMHQHAYNRSSLRFSTATYQRNLMSNSRVEMEQSSLRLKAREVVRSGESKYALKHLTKTLLRNPRDFYLAAAALLVESKYLAKLNHPNIVRVTGLAMSGGAGMMAEEQQPATKTLNKSKSIATMTIGPDHVRRHSGGDEEGLESGCHDSYFLITERLTDTLDRRIRQWKRDQPEKKLSELSSAQKIETWKLMMRKTSYALQLSNALAYLHERNLLYRDLKPGNIGFIGDNQTIVIFNFGLCRELNPLTGKVEEDDVTALFGALSWRYTAVECFPQPVVQTPAQLISTRLLHNHGSHSLGLDSLSIRGGRGTSSGNDNSIKGLQREFLAAQETFQEVSELADPLGATKPRQPLPQDKKNHQEDVHMIKASYDVKVDIYSWAMVYYEMLTMNQPFGNMTQKEHYRKVAGPKGGQRPGVYQFDLTPSMISLLQRAWDQNPQKRPTMESVGRNLQLILQELEVMIKAEQRSLLKAAGGTEEAVAAFTFREERAYIRAKVREEWDRQAKKARTPRGRQTSLSSSIMRTMKNKADGLFAGNPYRPSDARENVTGPDRNFGGPSPKATSDHLNNSPSASPRDLGVPLGTKAEIDLDALEYEDWSSVDGADGHGSSSLESEDPSSLTDHFGETGGARENAPAENSEVEIPVTVEEVENEDGGDGDLVGDAISALTSKRKDSRSPPSRGRNFSNGVGDSNKGGLRLRRKTKGDSIKQKPRRLLDTFSLERRGTNRMSRRTMRLSRASVWMMRRDVRFVLIVVSIVITLAFCGAGWRWYKKRQRTWLGVDLEYLGAHNKSNAKEILEAAILETCRHKQPSGLNLGVPLLFQGGAFSTVDQSCFELLRRQLDEKLAAVTGVETKKTNDVLVGFLNILEFDRPPPQPRKSRWRRKKAWKFFRQEGTRRITPDSDQSFNYDEKPGDVDTYPMSETLPCKTNLVKDDIGEFGMKRAWNFFTESSNVAETTELKHGGPEEACELETESGVYVDVQPVEEGSNL